MNLLHALAVIAMVLLELSRSQVEADLNPMRDRHEQRAREKRRLMTNSNGHTIGERHENGSMTLEIMEEGFSMPRRKLVDAISSDSDIQLDSSVELTYDPPNNASVPHALGVYVFCGNEDGRIYYETEDGSSPVDPTTSSDYATRSAPYIHMDSPFGSTRNRILSIVCVWTIDEEVFRSEQHTLYYIVEAGARPKAFGFLVPGIESDGYFLKFVIEQKAAARAQVAGGQEFSDFYTELGVGTYEGQFIPMRLSDLMPELAGFEGGYSVNCTNGKHYGILVPNHNGSLFTGVVARVDLQAMDAELTCQGNWRHEASDGAGGVIVSGNASSTAENACVHTLDLTTLHPNARGFRRGVVNMPYVFLSPGEFNVPVRLDVCDFGIATTKFLDLTDVRNDTLGGYSGGFSDGGWACFSPFRTFIGPFGGVRSSHAVDNGQLRAFYHAEVLCIYQDAWDGGDLEANIRTFDLSLINSGLRGFSDAVRVGRFAYLAPLSDRPLNYAYRLVRIYLGETDVGEMLDHIESSDMKLRDIVDVLDLKQVDSSLAGFSGIFNSGKYIFLVPYRNVNEISNGQRGHGKTVRVDMNIFDVEGCSVLDLSVTTRNQIPSFADEDLRGFSSGFASGKYCLYIPFYNAIFSGKLARIIGLDDDMSGNVQELNMLIDRERPDTYKGYRGGFVSLWQGANDVQ